MIYVLIINDCKRGRTTAIKWLQRIMVSLMGDYCVIWRKDLQNNVIHEENRKIFW
jgi:hypothetical protein